MKYNIEVARYKFKDDFHKTTVNHGVDGKIKNWKDDEMYKAFSADGVAMILYKNEGNSIIKQNFWLFHGQKSA